jgi:hypothetical protein
MPLADGSQKLAKLILAFLIIGSKKLKESVLSSVE